VRPPSPETFTPTPKKLIGGSVVLLAVAAVFTALNVSKVKTFRSTVAEAVVTREKAEQFHLKKESELKERESVIAGQNIKITEHEQRAAVLEKQLGQVVNEKKELEGKLQVEDEEITALRKQIEDRQPPSANPGAASTIELQAQLDDAREQLDTAEREKALLAEKMQVVQERSSQLEDEKKRRVIGHGKVGIHGKILVVNRAYNFVVLDLGGRNGVEPSSEMLVVRDGTFIGKIRICTVEPATAIGDIITSTLARGVQVQPGDIVIYAGSNS
jgi:hypothetical protein